jgi:hypothetical protein
MSIDEHTRGSVDALVRETYARGELQQALGLPPAGARA